MKKYILGMLLLSVMLIPTQALAIEAHPIDANIVDSKGVVYRIEGLGEKRKAPYTSAGAFLSYKFNSWNNVKTANSADMALKLSVHGDGSTYYIAPRPGSLVNDKGTVYIITNYFRTGFSSEAAFKKLGYSFENVYPGDTSFLKTDLSIHTVEMPHPAGTLINNKGTLYVMNYYGGRIGIPNLQVLESWGYWVGDAVPANSLDMSLSEVGAAQIRKESELNLFMSFVSNWNTFTATTEKYTLYYPPTWHFDGNTNDEKNPHLSNDSSVAGKVTIEIQANVPKDSQKDLMTAFKEYTGYPGGGMSASGEVIELEINGYKTIRVSNAGGEGPAGPGYFIERDNTRVFYILVYGTEDQDIVNKIVSSIAFTN